MATWDESLYFNTPFTPRGLHQLSLRREGFHFIKDRKQQLVEDMLQIIEPSQSP